MDRGGPVDILINNVGYSGGGITADTADALWFDVIDTNLNSVFRMTGEILTASGMQKILEK
jgi:ketoreductase